MQCLQTRRWPLAQYNDVSKRLKHSRTGRSTTVKHKQTNRQTNKQINKQTNTMHCMDRAFKRLVIMYKIYINQIMTLVANRILFKRLGLYTIYRVIYVPCYFRPFTPDRLFCLVLILTTRVFVFVQE